MRNHRDILSVILLVAALAWTLWFVFAGFGNHQDPLYWLYKYEHLEGGWMAVGTLLTGGGIVHLFGAHLLALRIAGWLCVVVAILLPYCCLLNKEQRREQLPWLALTFVFMGYGAFQEFSPGTLTVLLLSAIWVTACKSSIINDQSSIITAILAGIAITVRFPNILVLLILVPLWGKRSKWLLPTVLASAGIVYLLGYWLVTPAAIETGMGSHDIRHMIFKLWEHGGKLVTYMVMVFGVIMFGRVQSETWKGKTTLTALLVGMVLVYIVGCMIKPAQWYNGDLTYLISAICLMLAFQSSIINDQSPITNNPLPIGALILMIATLGTDTAWLKLFPAVLCLLPLVTVGEDYLYRRYLWIVLAVFSGIVAERFVTNSVAHTDLTQARTIASVKPYEHIAICATEQAWIQQVQADAKQFAGRKQVLALGQEMHLMRAVTGCEAARYNEFWSNIYDSVYTARYTDIIRAEHPVVFCSFSPQFKTKPTYRDGHSALEDMLRREGYQTIDRTKFRYTIYIPTNPLTH